jgi:hypothetical protein
VEQRRRGEARRSNPAMGLGLVGGGEAGLGLGPRRTKPEANPRSVRREHGKREREGCREGRRGAVCCGCGNGKAWRIYWARGPRPWAS